MNVTEQVRESIPKVLEKEDRLSEAELLEKLVVEIPELKKGGKVRSGVLRGVLNKLENIPVKDLEIEREGGRVYYTLKKPTEWNQLVDEFIQKVKDNNILKLDFTKEEDRNDEKIEFVRSVSDIIKQLEQLKQPEKIREEK